MIVNPPSALNATGANLECAARMVTALKAAAPVLAWSDTDNYPKILDAMALIGETNSICDFRQRHFGTGQKLLCSPHSALQYIAVWRHALSLFKDSGEMGGR